MSGEHRKRQARQMLETDRLLGADAVPLGEPRDAAPAGPTDEPDTERPTPANHPQSHVRSEEREMPRPATPLTRDAKEKILRRLDEEEVKGCTRCPLCESRTQTVFGEGDPDADLVFIGEGPGQNEDEQGRPFVGRAGELLEKQIVAMGLERGQVFIANIVKCRPPNNRVPTPAEADACSRYLHLQLETIDPKVIVALGATAAKLLLGDPKLAITKIRGQWQEYRGIAVMPTFHPAYLLRQYTRENRQRVWQDLQKVMERLGMREAE